MRFKKIILISIFIIVFLSFFAAYYFGFIFGAEKMSNRYLAEIRNMKEIELGLLENNKDSQFSKQLKPGKYVLELHFSRGVVKEKVIIEKVDDTFRIRSEKNIKENDPLEKGNITFRGNAIVWSWDAGYSGQEDYIGYLNGNCIIGNFYNDDGMAKWVIRFPD